MQSTADKIERIVTNLGDSKEDALALLRDLWHEVDYTSADSIRMASNSMIATAEAVKIFQEASDNLAAKIMGFTELSLPEKEKVSQPLSSQDLLDLFQGKEMIDLRSSWAYRRPFGFIMSGFPCPFKQTWLDLYFHLLTLLRDLDRTLFDKLPDLPEFTSIQGNPYITRDRNKLRIPMEVAQSIFLESNLHANIIRDNIGQVLKIFTIPESELEFYLRE